MTQANDVLSRAQSWLEEKPMRADLAATLALTSLWALFFWRVLTPNPANQVSYPEGDFSGQFLAFGAYQARRLLAGEIPLWNPYNYAGHPFLADTQAAVFYPPRVLTIFLSQLTGGWSYTALQAEALAHYWLGALAMFLFVKTLTHSRIAGLVSSITLAFGGYLTGYPPLQLAILEAGIWLPLSLLGVYRASALPAEAREQGRWRVRWLAVSALALGMSLLAGHPQTSLFYLYVLITYVIHRAAKARIRWLEALLAAGGVAVLGIGLAAIQVLPGLEYTRLTIRTGYGIDDLSHGFPLADLVSILLPNVVSIWSPLYAGVAGLALAGVAVWRRQDGARFWAAVALVALVLSFGGGTILYQMLYIGAPGVAWFRGWERAAYVIAHSVAILAGLGCTALLSEPSHWRKLSRLLGIGTALCWAFAVEVFIVSRLVQADISSLLNQSFMLSLLATATWLVLGRLGHHARRAWWPAAVIALIVFDLFSNDINTNWEPIPASERAPYHHELAAVPLADDGLFRVDGRAGLSHGNYGTLIGLQDIRGISPLRLNTLEQYMTHLPDYRLFQLLNVKYVFTDWQQLEIPSTIVASDTEAHPPLFVHEIDDPVPRTWMVYRVMVAADEAQALGWMADPSFDPRSTVILTHDPEIDLPAEPPERAAVNIVSYAPERIVIGVRSPADGVLILSEMDYPGWYAEIDGRQVPIWRADAGLRAVAVEAGTHEVVFTFRPAALAIGMTISLLSATVITGGLLLGQKVAISHGSEA